MELTSCIRPIVILATFKSKLHSLPIVDCNRGFTASASEDTTLWRYTKLYIIAYITGMAENIHGRGRLRTAWSDDIKDWTHLSTEEALQLTKDHAAWTSVAHHAANVRTSK